MKAYFGLGLILFAMVIVGVRISKRIPLKQNVTDHLKRAADASTIDLALAELTTVIDYLEANNMTTGYTSVLWKTPDEDIDFWYRNLKASQEELKQLNTTSALEKTNVLIKLRETLVDTGESTKVTIPKGLSVYPDNTLWFVLMWIAAIAGITGFGYLGMAADQHQKEQQRLASSE